MLLAVLNYTKATLSSRNPSASWRTFERFREIFPEHADWPIVGILASPSGPANGRLG
jgi:hypothetical protein